MSGLLHYIPRPETKQMIFTLASTSVLTYEAPATLALRQTAANRKHMTSLYILYTSQPKPSLGSRSRALMAMTRLSLYEEYCNFKMR